MAESFDYRPRELSKMEPTLVTEPSLMKILEELKKQEPIFHHPGPNPKRSDLESLMEEHFWEVGASGRRYSREFCIDTLMERYKHQEEDIWQTSEFHCLEIAPDNYLLTYTLAQGARISRRSTIWRKTPSGWKVLFHQGTLV